LSRQPTVRATDPAGRGVLASLARIRGLPAAVLCVLALLAAEWPRLAAPYGAPAAHAAGPAPAHRSAADEDGSGRAYILSSAQAERQPSAGGPDFAGLPVGPRQIPCFAGSIESAACPLGADPAVPSSRRARAPPARI
jgi:hypothetical protein